MDNYCIGTVSDASKRVVAQFSKNILTWEVFGQENILILKVQSKLQQLKFTQGHMVASPKSAFHMNFLLQLITVWTFHGCHNQIENLERSIAD